ncbi:unknown [Vaccinia virus WR]|uniref:Uncharacterized protein VACWR201 n=3 Tax=Vaccinia virus TaxID=10245 RepID=VA201_VACCW|nr:hypothetical protein VACWR201 [Vaccinia virus]Q80HT7.1 RecName: Full=Uncharacterized protein VACWR201 [Vaccinia virus WR]AAF34091.1 unknown [Vaccinia virus Tian Tan]AAO89480.1 unknown [Vaccinia virus WR]
MHVIDVDVRLYMSTFIIIDQSTENTSIDTTVTINIIYLAIMKIIMNIIMMIMIELV